MRPITSLVENPPTMVSELIDNTIASWREEVIRATFLPFDADTILSIPLCTRVVEDFWAWSCERSGIFSVKSAYHMIMNTKEHRENWMDVNAGTSAMSMTSKAWTDLWHIRVPSKLRVFL